MEKKEKRFIIKSATNLEFGSLMTIRVVVDKETGVNYMLVSGDGLGGVQPVVTPLLGQDGKVIIDKLPIEENK